MSFAMFASPPVSPRRDFMRSAEIRPSSCSVYSCASFCRITGSSSLPSSLASFASRLRGRTATAARAAGADLTDVVADAVAELARDRTRERGARPRPSRRCRDRRVRP